jgi:prepilin-type N-terminal cleavage/methylation domain-containing protein
MQHPAPQPLSASRRRRGGFTLFEVLIAIAVLVIGVIAVSRTINMAFRATAASEASLRALNFARLEMEALRDKKFSSPELALGTRTFTRTVTNGTTVATYSGTVGVSAGSNDGLREVVVRVAWSTPYQQTPPPPVELVTTFATEFR